MGLSQFITFLQTNGSGHLHKVLPVSKVETFRAVLMRTERNQLKSEWGCYNIDQTIVSNLVLLESLTYQNNLTEAG